MADNYLQLNTDKTEILISATHDFVPKMMGCLGPLPSSVKSTLHNLSVFMGQTVTLDKHVYSLVHSCFHQLRHIASLRPTVRDHSWK